MRTLVVHHASATRAAIALGLCCFSVGAIAGVVVPATGPTASAKSGGNGPSGASAEQHGAPKAAQHLRSMDGGTGLYFLPPLPGRPNYVRPGVDTAYQSTSPLSPKEIEWIKRRMADSQYAMHKGAPLDIKNPIMQVAMGPGGDVPVIRVARGYVTTLSVVDSEGNPWPITSYVIGGGSEAGAAIFNVQSPVNGGGGQRLLQPTPASSAAGGKSGKPVLATMPSNMLTLSPAYYGASSNMVITLEGQSTPIMVDIISGSPAAHQVYGMVTLRVDRMGPEAPVSIMQAPPPSPVQSQLMLFMAQTPPKDTVSLRASGGYGVHAWNWRGQTIVRSRVPLAMPAWTAEIQQDGVRVYETPMTTQLLLRTQNGMENVTLRKSNDLLEDPDANYLIATKVAAVAPKSAPAPVLQHAKAAPPIIRLLGGK